MGMSSKCLKDIKYIQYGSVEIKEVDSSLINRLSIALTLRALHSSNIGISIRRGEGWSYGDGNCVEYYVMWSCVMTLLYILACMYCTSVQKYVSHSY